MIARENKGGIFTASHRWKHILLSSLILQNQIKLINLANKANFDSFVLSVKSQYSEFKTKPCAAKGLLTGEGGKNVNSYSAGGEREHSHYSGSCL